MSGAEDVEEAVIKPMRAAFPPPIHLRGNRHAIEMALNVYRRALDRFERSILEQAFQKAAEENAYVMWPKCADILSACKQIEKAQSPPPDAWVEEATALTDQYVRRFMKTSQHAARAREGGYEAELQRYVQEAAHVQAQYIAGRQGVGYDHTALFGGPLHQDREAEEEFFARAREQAARGFIRVSVPTALVKQWQEATEGHERAR